MRYFVYISDAKIDVLLPQVPGATQQKVATQLGFDIKLLSGSVTTEHATLDSRVARLRTVETYLLDHAPIGTPDEPLAWVQGEMSARFIDLGLGGIIFIGGSEAWRLALGGSAHHLVGGVKPEKIDIPMSFAPQLAERIRYLAEKKARAILGLPEGSVSVTTKNQGFDAWVELIGKARNLAVSPAQNIRFLAKRLASTRDRAMQITLASPLYVELVD